MEESDILNLYWTTSYTELFCSLALHENAQRQKIARAVIAFILLLNNFVCLLEKIMLQFW